MANARTPLSAGTRLQWDGNSIYEITSSPIGLGGGGIIYPARRLVMREDQWLPDGFQYALKECYPISAHAAFIRNADGQIVPEDDSHEAVLYLQRSKQLQWAEKEVSRKIYRTASRMLPIRDITETVLMTQPGKEPVRAENTVTVMDSLSEKGHSISAWMRERKRFTPLETFRIIQQLLFSLREIHQAGFLHLDIQDGNIFLRGTLTSEDKSELVTLIDFGSTRPMVSGKTEPIQDRVIFTSRGFSAPEILLHNDGTLQLGPEADLYSVGCLILYLLTGHKADPKILLANKSGVYLKANEVRRLKCPPHLVDRMQMILGKSLEREVAQRYHSVDEMLTEVTDLISAMQPYRTDLSEVVYDAFICYKHGPVDSQAAIALQRALENYRAPKGVAKVRKPFRRVFVDEGELSSCADFGQQIREALKNSGWLIVVCSPDTPLSPWVQLEIETFLEYHDRSRILAVLTGGDVETSFPPQLKGDDKGVGEVFAPHAQGDSVQEVVRNLRGDTLLKLVAPMLGTSYDTLKQRHKIYRTQRVAMITAGFLAASLGFAGYAWNRANVIEEQYKNTLINESMFLVEQAEKALNNNDPLEAMRLALQALPSAQQDRPIVTEAEYVLGKALGIYRSPAVANGTASTTGLIQTEDEHFFLDDMGTLLISWSTYDDHIQIWNAETLSLIQEISVESLHSVPTDLVCVETHTLITRSTERIQCLDYLTGEIVWSRDDELLIAVCSGGTNGQLAVLSGENRSSLSDDTETDIDSVERSLIMLSSQTGEVIRQVSFIIDSLAPLKTWLNISENQKWAVVASEPSQTTSENEDSSQKHSVYRINLETGAVLQLFQPDAVLVDVEFVDNQLAVMRHRGEYAFVYRVNGVNKNYLYPRTQFLEFYDLETGKLRWRSEYSYYAIKVGAANIKSTAYDNDEVQGEGLVFTFSDRAVLIDRQTGKVIRDYEFSDIIVGTKYGRNGIQVVCMDGHFAIAAYTMDIVLDRKTFLDNASTVEFNGDDLYIQNAATMFEEDYTIRKYVQNKADDNYEELYQTDSNNWDLYTICQTPNGTRVVLTLDRKICLWDEQTGKAWIQEIPEWYNYYADFDLIGTSSDGTRVYWENNDGTGWIQSDDFFVIDLISGEIKMLEQPAQPYDRIAVQDILLSNNTFYFTAESWEPDNSWLTPDAIHVFQWDLESGALTQLYTENLSKWNTTNTKSESCSDLELQIDENLQRLYFSVDLSFYRDETYIKQPCRMICLDLKTGEASSIALDFPFTEGADQRRFSSDVVFCWNEDGTQAVIANGTEFYVADANGVRYYDTPMGRELVHVQYWKDENTLLLTTSDAEILQWDLETETCQYQLDLNQYADISPVYDFSLACTMIDHQTMLFQDTEDSILLDLSGETPKVKACITDCCGYNPDGSYFYTNSGTWSSENVSIGKYPYYSLEDLIDRANQILN